jgi:hypothetical protein
MAIGQSQRFNMKNTEHPVYHIWNSMRQRCNNPNSAPYRNYGGRGITICERWDSFNNFVEDMGSRPDGALLERKDNNGPYNKENCRWATRSEQNRNKRDNHLVTHNGETKCLAEWVERSGLNRRTLTKRLAHGWDFATAISTPSRNHASGKV